MTTTESSNSQLPLAGLRVLDASQLIAGPITTTLLADFGAEVIKIEHPTDGDALRHHGQTKNGEPLWWKFAARNKKTITLYLGHPEGQAIFKELAKTVDVVVENFRPGTLAKWGLSYDVLSKDNPKLIVAHVSGFGQIGPRSGDAGFGTLGEAMSGFAFRNGYPDTSPTLPPFGTADVVTGLLCANAIFIALRARDQQGIGQEVDVAIVESLLQMLEPQILEYDQFGTVMPRLGNRNPMNSPRGIYQTSDDRWLAISASTIATATRVMQLVGHPEFVEQPWFPFANQRAEHADELDAAIQEWMIKQPLDVALKACQEVGTAAAPVYNAADILEDEQYQALGTIVTVKDDVLGDVRMPNVPFRLTKTPGSVRWVGAKRGEYNDEIYKSIGLTDEKMAELRELGVI